MDNTVGRLNHKQKSLVIGSLLGDGYMRIIEGRADAFLEINHSAKAKKYVDWKYNILKNLCASAPKERVSGVDRMAYRFYTKQSPEFTAIYKVFYKNKKKIIPKTLQLDSVILAIWYMDDGSKTINKDNSNNVNIYLNTQQFSMNDQKFLLHLLREIGINARLNKDKQYYRVRILKESVDKFMKIINTEMEDSMRYKMI